LVNSAAFLTKIPYADVPRWLDIEQLLWRKAACAKAAREAGSSIQVANESIQARWIREISKSPLN